MMSDALRVKLIGKGHKHRDTAQTKVTLREVVEVAKTFEATVFANQLMKTARNTQQEQVNFTSKTTSVNPRQNLKPHSNFHSVFGVAATINSPVNSIAQHLAKDVESVGSMVISRVSVEVGQDDKDDSSNRIFSMMTPPMTPPQLARKFFCPSTPHS